MTDQDHNNTSRRTHNRPGVTNGGRMQFTTHILMPLILLAAVAVTVGLALVFRVHSRNRASQAAEASTTAASTAVVLEKNAYPAVNELFQNYYAAMTEGDTDAIAAMSSELSDEEKIRIGEISKYIDSYPSIDVYTKTGPVEQSYVCYVVTKMKFKDHDWEVPGMQTMYVCTNDQGKLYINNAHDQDKAVTDYIQRVSLQDDVVDLNNKVTADYNKLVADNADLSAFLNELSSNIDVSVGQALAQLQKNSAAGTTENSSAAGTAMAAGAETASDGTEDAAGSDNADAASSNGAASAADSGSSTSAQNDGDSASYSSSRSTDQKSVTANDVVNVRNAASEDADIIGTTTKGDTYTLISESVGSGWIEISFAGQPGYVKAEYFSDTQ